MTHATATYTGTVDPFKHMATLMEQLPFMTDKWQRYQKHVKAARICQQFQAVDDLAQSVNVLEHQTPLEIAEYGGLHQKVLDEKRLRLEREKRRLAADLEQSPFNDMQQAHAALIATSELNSLVREVNRFREEYAYTFTQCQKAEDEANPLL